MFQKQPAASPSYHGAQSGMPDEVETVVGPSVHVEGDFSSEGNILVKGTVSGNVKTSKLLTVEHGAKIFANVKGANAFIAGEVKGNVRVDDKLELTATARIEGDIACSVLVVEGGALIHGKVSMKGIDIPNPKSDMRKPLRLKMKEDDGMQNDIAMG